MALEGRRTFFFSMMGGVVIFVILVAYALFVRFPLLTETGDAHLQRWVGPAAARVFYLLLVLLIGGLFIWVTQQQVCRTVSEHNWKIGAGIGAIGSLMVIILYVLTGVYATTSIGLQLPYDFLMGCMLLAPLLASIYAARITHRYSAGLLAGFWVGVMLALFPAIGLLVRDMLLANHLLHAWMGDHFTDVLCNDTQGAIRISCEVGDDLSFSATGFVLFPVIGLVLGTLGGLAAGKSQSGSRSGRMVVVVPLVVTGLLFVIFVAELIGQLW